MRVAVLPTQGVLPVVHVPTRVSLLVYEVPTHRSFRKVFLEPVETRQLAEVRRLKTSLPGVDPTFLSPMSHAPSSVSGKTLLHLTVLEKVVTV